MYEANTLLDTGAVQSAMSVSELRKVINAHSEVALREIPAPESKLQIANGNLVKDLKHVFLRFS